MIAIHEPIYRPGQLLADPAFLPLQVPDDSRAGWREFAIIVSIYREGLHRRQRLTGLLSPRFREKTGISGAAFVAFIEANPGADVYMINPYPHFAYLSHDVWMQGEGAHPGIVSVAQELLDACRIDWDLGAVPRHGPDTLCYSNFWVGTEKFWDDYVGKILLPIAEFIENSPNSPVARAVLADTRHTEPTPFLPFIIERLFSTYLSLAKPKVAPFLLDPVDRCVTDFERDIVGFVLDRVKRADRDGAFPEQLKQWMQMMLRLRRHYATVYYSNHPHPRRGTRLAPEVIQAILRDLESETGPRPLA